MQEYLDDTEHAMLGMIGSPELLEPMIIICGGGLEKAQVDKGRVATSKFIRLVVREYMERIAAAGLAGHARRSRIPAMVDRISAARVRQNARIESRASVSSPVRQRMKVSVRLQCPARFKIPPAAPKIHIFSGACAAAKLAACQIVVLL